MRAKTKLYVCDDCGERGEFTSYVKARGDGWAVSKDYKNCYCPECAPTHRIGGANGKQKTVKIRARDISNIDDDSITRQERTLIKNFRKLSPYMKKVMLETVRDWATNEDTKSLHKKA